MVGVFERLCEKRGLTRDFLEPKYEQLTDPMLMPGMKEGVERIKKAVESGEKVLIYGDYDVDGVTASTLMYDTLKLAGIKEVEVMLPDRFLDGYGMSEKVVERAKEGEFSLVVTVDCGSRNFEIIEKLKNVEVEAIITDHHECEDKLPMAVTVINPKRQGAEVGDLRDLAGVGVAFMVAKALSEAGVIPEGQEKWLLDLVVIGTLCDSMRLSQQNRILTYYGMKVLAKTRRPGLKEVLKLCQVKRINAETIGYRIGPRLNAAGRIESAELSLKLLMTKDKIEAANLAKKLESLNTERKIKQKTAVEEIREKGVGEDPVIVVTGNWHEGVLGIIAGKLVEEYKKPAFVLSRIGEVYKGSGRSFGDFNLAEALRECQKVIIGGGGHAEACGLKVAVENIDDFRTEVNKYYQGLKLVEQEKYLRKKIDLVVEEMGDFSIETMERLEKLEPFGVGNEEPIYLLSNVRVREVRKMGTEGQHLALNVAGADGRRMKLVAFSAPKRWLRLMEGERLNVQARVFVNEYMGLESVEGQIEGIEVVGD